MKPKLKKPKKPKTYLLDKYWGLAVRKKAGNKCEYCSKTEYLNPHHIFGRRNRSVRWDIDNGICLCSGCHVFSTTFSAHQTPTRFTQWIIKKRGEGWYKNLEFRAGVPYKPSTQELIDLLNQLKNV